jgi:3',5'-cyclic AMP phosphodiesterase CpdA
MQFARSLLSRSIAASLAAALVTCCAYVPAQRTPGTINFAVIGNTNPESPFGSVSPRVEAALAAINQDNPLFAVHLGNIVYGGKDWMGVRENDLSRQFFEFFNLPAGRRLLLYTVKGDLDEFNGSPVLYMKYTGKNRYYSFDCGAVHFVVLDTTDPDAGTVGPAQIKWLSSDLERFRNSPAIIVMAHHALVTPAYPRSLSRGDLCKNAGEVISLLSRYPVKAVFSGRSNAFSLEKRDGTLFVNAGCGGFNKSDQYVRAVQYYLVRFEHGTLYVTERRIN